MADVAIDRPETAFRTAPLGSGHVAVSPVGPRLRFSLRGGTEALLRACHGFGLDPPTGFLRANEGNSRAALSLGPDEILLLGPADDAMTVDAVVAAIEGEPSSVVDVSHRQVGFDISGASAADLLNAGCPLDLSLAAFPVGMCTRTVLAKADVTLWRRGPNRFRLEVNRSFARYVSEFLREAEWGL